MPLHVGLISDEYPPGPHGGIGSSNQDLAEGLVEAGHTVSVVGIYPKQHKSGDRTDPLSVTRLQAFPNWLRPMRGRVLADRWKLRQWLKKRHAEKPFDIIEFSDYQGWLPWGGPSQVPIVARLQGTNMLFDQELNRSSEQFEYSLEKKSLLRCSYWIGISEYVFRSTLALCDLQKKPGIVIPHAVDTSYFSPSDQSHEEGLIVFINRIVPRKGVAELVESANYVCARFPKAHFVFIGQDSVKTAGPIKYHQQCLEKLKPEYRSRVQFVGRIARSDLLPWLRRAHLCCFPSHAETCGIAPLEAMSVGRPTIFSTCGPGSEILEHGVSGLLCDPRDPKDIAEKINRIMDDAAFAARLGANARQRVFRYFDKKKWIQQNIVCFEQWAAEAKTSFQSK